MHPGRERWRLASPGLWRCWDGECAYYQSASGDTHLLSEAAVCLLELLQQGPRDLNDLTSNLSQRFEPPSEPSQMGSHVLALLDDLAKARLVECSPD